MTTKPLIYELTSEGKVSMKRKIRIGLSINYSIAVIIFLWNFSKQELTVKYALVGCLFILLGGLIYNLKKYDKLIDSEKLEVGEANITLIKLGKPVKNLRIAEIKSIDPNSYGIKLISKHSSTPSLFINKNFESFEEIRKMIEERIQLSDNKTVSD